MHIGLAFCCFSGLLFSSQMDQGRETPRATIVPFLLFAAGNTSAAWAVCTAVSTDTSHTMTSTAGRACTSRAVCVAGCTGTSSAVSAHFPIQLDRKKCCLAARSTGTARAVSAASDTSASSAVCADATTAKAISSVRSLAIGTRASSRVACAQSAGLSHSSTSEGGGSKTAGTDRHAGHAEHIHLRLLREREKDTKLVTVTAMSFGFAISKTCRGGLPHHLPNITFQTFRAYSIPVNLKLIDERTVDHLQEPWLLFWRELKG